MTLPPFCGTLPGGGEGVFAFISSASSAVSASPKGLCADETTDHQEQKRRRFSMSSARSVVSIFLGSETCGHVELCNNACKNYLNFITASYGKSASVETRASFSIWLGASISLTMEALSFNLRAVTRTR